MTARVRKIIIEGSDYELRIFGDENRAVLIWLCEPPEERHKSVREDLSCFFNNGSVYLPLDASYRFEEIVWKGGAATR
jgi:hypothetical protein